MSNEENKTKQPVKRDSDFYRKMRAARKNYPKHSGQFNKETAKELGSIGGKNSKKPKAKKRPATKKA